jgi:two-component system, NtrC family, response regulator HupR/HoxA
MDYERFQNLHAITLIKDVLRKWWGVSLNFADPLGTVYEWEKGNIVAPSNDFCRLSLFSKEGFRRCSASVRVLGEKFGVTKKLRHSQVHDCHLGFSLVGAPIYLNNVYAGMLYVEGVARHALNDNDKSSLKTKIDELNPGSTNLSRAADRVGLLSDEDLERMSDLLEFGAAEIAAFDAEQHKKDASAQAALGEQPEHYTFENIVGHSPAMLEIFKLLEKVCHSESTVLVNGESGTGKELVARAIHYNGVRRGKPFVVQNCSAFNDNLLESALFGHVKGSFTGAIKDKKGLFEIADGGTFFLDEIGDMSPALQVKLLRVLQEGTFIPVGGNHPKKVDVRVIAATHKDLQAMVQAGEFREDLFYRINVIRLEVPPLRERREDVGLLIEHFLRKHRREGQRVRGLSPATLSVLQRYPWPGNIRELENEIERMLVLAGDDDLIPVDLVSARIRDNANNTTPTQTGVVFEGGTVNLNEAVEQLERQLIANGLNETQGNRSKLARQLGISRSNLLIKIQKYGLQSLASGDSAITSADSTPA